MSSELEKKEPGALRRTRQRSKLTPAAMPAIDTQNLEGALNQELGAIESEAVTQGYNVAIALHGAKQRGFATGLSTGMAEAATVTDSFFRECIGAAGASLG
jgi:hypothetical protein